MADHPFSSDWTEELSRLLIYTANVADCIYQICSCKLLSEEKWNHVLWLSGALKNFDKLGSALRNNNLDQILISCDKLLWEYGIYQKDKTTCTYQPKPIFEQYDNYFKLQDAIKLFEAIKVKVGVAKDINYYKNRGRRQLWKKCQKTI